MKYVCDGFEWVRVIRGKQGGGVDLVADCFKI